jgi:branched-chain amino acid aminotransferase
MAPRLCSGSRGLPDPLENRQVSDKNATVLSGLRLVPRGELLLDVRSQAIGVGASVAEGLRAYWNDAHKQLYLFRLEDHLDRFEASCRLLHIRLPADPSEVARLVCELLRRNEFKEDAYIRLIAYKGEPSRFGITLTDAPDEFAGFAFALRNRSSMARSISACCALVLPSAPDQVLLPSRIKVASEYTTAAIAKTAAVAEGFDECILLTVGGHVVGTTTANIFLSKNSELVTPAITRNVFPGLTRASLIELAAAELGLMVVERTVEQSELLDADDVFLCGTGSEVVSIGRIDDHLIAASGQTIGHRLHSIYVEAARANAEKYSARWCSAVY